MNSTLSSGSTRERDLIEAALAVNRAPSLDEAFAVLADAGVSLLAADWLTFITWDAQLASGVVRAGSGSARELVGVVVPADEDTVNAILTETPFNGPPRLEELPSSVRDRLQGAAFVIRVPVVTQSYRATLHASWKTVLEADEVEDAVALLQTLARLTTLAERALREQHQASLETVLEGVGDGVVLTMGGRAIANAAAKKMLALPDDVEFRSALFNPRELDGTPFDVNPAHLPGQSLIGTGQEGGRFRIRATALDDRELVIDGSVAPVDGGAVIVFRDVTDEHHREYVTEQYAKALFNAMPAAIAVLDPVSHEVVATNPAFRELVGLDAEAIAGLTPPYPWWAPGEDAAGGFAPREVVERVYSSSDGRTMPVQTATHVVPGEDEEPVLLLQLVTDLSERRRLEQQLVQSGKLAAIGELAAGVAHEINNPLFAILGLTEFLLKEAEPGSKSRERLELIEQTGLEIKEIVRALLDFARENPDERQVAALEDIVRSTIDLVRRTNAYKGVEIVDSYDGSEARVNASANQLKQLFLNLIANARQAMPHGGTIHVDVRRDRSHVLATVADDGPGIPTELLGRIFEPFFTTKRLTGGTGLGLSASLGIAEAHGGTLTVESELARGATFTLRVPIAEEMGR